MQSSTEPVGIEVPAWCEAVASPPPPVAGIGASAGGLEALERFFRAMPSDTGIAFVVVQHLSPDFKSVMDELLARHTRMPIHRVEDGMAVEANSVYLIPPRKEMIIAGGRLLLSDKDPGQDLNLPIDRFFRSLAHEVGRSAIAIVLSGTGSDGSRGVREVHQAGGLVIAQSDGSAKFDGMPKSAIETGCVDLVLDPEGMAAPLADRARRLAAEAGGRVEGLEGAAYQGIDRIVQMLRDEYGIDFSLYKPSTVARRIERRLSLNQAHDLDDYVDRLERDREERSSLYRDLLIGVTRFFRDRDAFDLLEREVLPGLFAHKRPGEEIRVWVAGVATGEEAYSLAILLHERFELIGRPPNLKVFATDVHGASLEAAAGAVYAEEAVADVRPSRLARYFVRKGNRYAVNAEIRKLVVFARHNVLKDAPFTKLDLISCRNLLIYFQPGAQRKALSLFHFGLRVGGVLFLGPSESPGELGAEFETVDERWKMYRKRRDARLPPDMRLPLSSAPPARPLPVIATSFDAGLLGAYDRLLQEFAPPGLLVTDVRQLVHAMGGAGRYLVVRDGRPSGDVLDLVEGDLKLALAGSLQRASKDRATVSYSGIRVTPSGGTEQLLKITVKPILDRQSNVTHFFIALQDLGAAPAAARPETEIDVGEASKQQLSSLESELRHARENLQATIEELETSNEELQASNEELVASNEELQSTNEELHSVNEELYTVNAEYQKKIVELTELTDDMDNLLRSTDIATVFLDRSLCIRKFTPQVAQVFDLLPHDIGRRIDGFSHGIESVSLAADLQSVLDTGSPIEKQVRHRNGSWFFLRILPYRSHTQLDGVVLTLIDVTSLRRAERRVLDLSAIVECSDDAIIGMDLEGRITSWNPGATRLYGYTAEEVLGRQVSMLRPPVDSPAPAALDWPPEVVERMRAGESADFHLERVRRRKDGSLVDVMMSFSPIRDSDGTLIGVSKIARDVTERKRREEALRIAEAAAQEQVRRRDQFLAMLSHELRNPLAALVNAAHLLELGKNDPAALAVAQGTISRQSRHMARLLDDLLDVSRITHDRIEIRRTIVDLRQSASDALEAVRPLLANRRLELSVGLPDEPLCVHGDPARLQQIQVNLLNNAIKHTPDGGRIALTLGAEGDDAVIRVTDTGEGIPPEMHERIFELFVQLDRSDGNASAGMGVGLTLVRALVDLHGGAVAVQSEPGRGSEFSVRLPAVEAGRLDGDEPQRLAKARDLRVVLVEDNADIRAVTSEVLRWMGCEVVAVENGRLGIEAIAAHAPAAALVDIGLPDMDGYEVARTVRSRLGPNGVRLIAVTGFGQSVDREKALAAGFDDHLVKPVEATALSRVLRELAGRR